MTALVPVAELFQEPVVAAHFAVVARHDDHGRVGQAAAHQEIEERSEAVVNLPLGPVVRGPDLTTVEIASRSHDVWNVEHHAGKGVDRPLVPGCLQPANGPICSAS